MPFGANNSPFNMLHHAKNRRMLIIELLWKTTLTFTKHGRYNILE